MSRPIPEAVSRHNLSEALEMLEIDPNSAKDVVLSPGTVTATLLSWDENGNPRIENNDYVYETWTMRVED
jgi:hypothetical protein